MPYVVVYDGVAFHPQSVVIKKGQVVLFKNESSLAFWPASNSHPSHRVMNEFDPKEPIASGDSWSFRFTKAGNWEYHDHVSPTHEGVVVVLDAYGKQVDPNDCTKDSNKHRCWKLAVDTALAEDGIEAALTLIGSLFETQPGYKESCHDMVHQVGEASFSLFMEAETQTITSKTAYCGYGFFHGFMETLITTTNDLDQARAFCELVDQQLGATDPNAKNACYHGIGHGAIDGSDPRAWGNALQVATPAMALCEKVAADQNQLEQCANGIFDGLITAYTEQSYGLTIEPEHIYDLCTQIDNETFKSGCYIQMNPLASYFGKQDVGNTFALINTIKEEAYKGVALRTVAGTFAFDGLSQQRYNEVAEGCLTFEGDIRELCIAGFVQRLSDYGSLGREYELGLDFCSLSVLPLDVATDCYARVAAHTYPSEKRAQVCGLISSRIDIASVNVCSPDALQH